MEGPDPTFIKPLVGEALPKLIDLMTDTSVVVRDTVAWTLGRVCELLPEVVLQDSAVQVPADGTGQPRYQFQTLLDALITNLQAEPRVAANVCWVSPHKNKRVKKI